MKLIKNLLFSGFIIFLFSCEVTKESATTNRETSGGRNTTNTERSVNTQDSRINSRIKENDERMFQELGMNQNQIKQYQDSWKHIQSSSRGRSNQGMTEFERIEHQDKIMKEILDDAQFKKYQSWVLEQARNEK